MEHAAKFKLAEPPGFIGGAYSVYGFRSLVIIQIHARTVSPVIQEIDGKQFAKGKAAL